LISQQHPRIRASAAAFATIHAALNDFGQHHRRFPSRKRDRPSPQREIEAKSRIDSIFFFEYY
jgi:hypothetical protein